MTNEPIIIIGSARQQSDTKSFVEFVFDSIESKTIDLLDFNVSPYDYECRYPENDSFLKIIDEILKHNVIVFATPVYWYSMSGRMKVFFDRLTDLVTINKQIGRRLKGKSIFLIAVGTDEKLPQGFEIPFKLTSDYLEMTFKNSIYFSSKYINEYKLIDKNIFIDEINKARAANSK